MGTGMQGRPARRVAAAVSLVVLLAAGCGGGGAGAGAKDKAESPGQSPAAVLGAVHKAAGQPVKIGIVSDGHYVAADQTVEFAVARATAKWLNERRGGIGGRPIELVTCETLGDPAKGTDCGNQMVDDHVAAVVIGSSAVADDAWRPVHDAGVPTIMAAAGANEILGDTRSTFVMSDATSGTIDMPIQRALDAKVKKVTVIVIDVPPAIEPYQGAGKARFTDAGLDLELVRVPIGTADMTPQLERVVSDHPGLIHVLGNDSFCISAFQALQALNFDGPVTAIPQCITDATRRAIPGARLKGIVTPFTAPIGDAKATRLYEAVVGQYGQGIDTSREAGHIMFSTLAGFALALERMHGDVTPSTIISTMKAMPDEELPNGAGLHFRCDGKANPATPAVCTRGVLLATLDGSGKPSGYQPTSTAPID